jgi:hypothetical protein
LPCMRPWCWRFGFPATRDNCPSHWVEHLATTLRCTASMKGLTLNVLPVRLLLIVGYLGWTARPTRPREADVPGTGSFPREMAVQVPCATVIAGRSCFRESTGRAPLAAVSAESRPRNVSTVLRHLPDAFSEP